MRRSITASAVLEGFLRGHGRCRTCGKASFSAAGTSVGGAGEGDLRAELRKAEDVGAGDAAEEDVAEDR
jgi:hypothetical protein